MKSKRLYVLLTLVPVLMLIGGLSFNGKALSANINSAREGLQANQHLSLSLQSNVSQSPSAYSGYTRVNDNEDKITLQVPVEWNDIETGKWTYKGRNMGVFVAASGDLGNFYSTRSQPGVLIGVSHALAGAYGKEGLLDLEKRDHARSCLYKDRFDFQNQFYVGQYDQYTNCAAGTPNLLVFTTASADQKYLILLRIIVASEADIEAADTILSTFQVLGNPERDDHHGP
ncbi:MAG TPA: hypothetical protein VF918_04590 [Anaerolineales bacterium]